MNAHEYIKTLFIELHESYVAWEPLQTSADERAYDILGRIYEEAAKIDADHNCRQALIERGRAPLLRESAKFANLRLVPVASAGASVSADLSSGPRLGSPKTPGRFHPGIPSRRHALL